MDYCFNIAELFQLAIEIKENGCAFYEQAQKIIHEPELKRQFADLAAGELEHKKKIEKIKTDLPWSAASPTVPDPENELELYIKAAADQHTFRTCGPLNVQLEKIKDAADALKLALQFEKDSVIFLMSLQEAVCEGKDRDLVDLLLKEEMKRVKQLSLRLQRISSCSL